MQKPLDRSAWRVYNKHVKRTRKGIKTMMNIREYFDRYYEDNGYDKSVELENLVYGLYKNDEIRFQQWANDNKVDLDAVVEMLDGSEEYAITLWVWDNEEA